MKKLNKIGPFGYFDLWSMVNANQSQSMKKCQGSSMVNGSRLVIELHCPSWVNDRAIELLMSNDDVLVMWTRANVDMLVWLLT